MAIPTIPAPPANLISPQGQTSPANYQWTSFLPSNGGVATGLTPQMLRPMGPAPAPAAAAPQQSSYQQLLSFFGGMGGQNGWGSNWGGGGNNGGYGSWPTIPKPTAGAGGLINPGDLSAYTTAQSQQDKARSGLARQMSRRQQQQRWQQRIGGRGSDRDRG